MHLSRLRVGNVAFRPSITTWACGELYLSWEGGAVEGRTEDGKREIKSETQIEKFFFFFWLKAIFLIYSWNS